MKRAMIFFILVNVVLIGFIISCSRKASEEVNNTTWRQSDIGKVSDMTVEQRILFINNPPSRSVGWMDVHEGAYTENCTLVDVSGGWADHRNLENITTSSRCDVPGHYGETHLFRGQK